MSYYVGSNVHQARTVWQFLWSKIWRYSMWWPYWLMWPDCVYLC